MDDGDDLLFVLSIHSLYFFATSIIEKFSSFDLLSNAYSQYYACMTLNGMTICIITIHGKYSPTIFKACVAPEVNMTEWVEESTLNSFNTWCRITSTLTFAGPDAGPLL